MKPIPINGIRLGPGVIWTGQDSSRPSPLFPVCQALSTQRINMVCAGLHRLGKHEWFSCCVESRYREVVARLADEDGSVSTPADVIQVSVYPHRYRIDVPAVLMKMLATADIPFYHLVSSSAVISVIIDTRYQDQVIALLEDTFDLPASHTPYIQEIDQEISALLKKYPETRSTYVEEKIRTYGIQLIPGVTLLQMQEDQGRLMQMRHRLISAVESDTQFHLVSVIQTAGRKLDAVFVLKLDADRTDGAESGDLITFHGPHFGDRYRIFQSALNCLEIDHIPLRAAACAGASISLVFPAGEGAVAQTALAKGFEAP
ncbi:MAG: hypothetical protein RQ739_09070 [Desulfotignum sp.]|nr:hypothetical protein [Desulfotignum sp.]